MENKSISELEGWRWKDEIPSITTHGGIECRFYELHNVPLGQLAMDDIRFLIGQNSGLEYLVPIALKELQKNMFVATEYYEGDLLHSLLNINDSPNYWLAHQQEKQELINLYKEQKHMLCTLDISATLKKKIKEAFQKFAE